MSETGRKIAAAVPCTCGELFQGMLQGSPCLVSCPIAVESCAYLLDKREDFYPQGKKVRRALAKLAGISTAARRIVVQTPLPVGRGFGTSTADIGAALFAAGADNGLALSAEEAARIAVSVEPTDSTLFPGLTLFAHRSGSFSQFLGAAPQAKVLVIDPGGFVDSEEFNCRQSMTMLAGLAHAQRDAYELLKEGIQKSDLSAIGRAASLSAELHQRILFNPLLEKVLQISGQVGAAGVCRAHSGTVLGLLLAAEREDEADLMRYCRSRLPDSVRYIRTQLTNGGVRWPEASPEMAGDSYL